MAATVWKGHLSFGLISIPVRLARAARPERVSLHQVYRGARPEPAPTAAEKVIELPRRKGAPAPEPAPEPAPAPESVTRVRESPVAESTGEAIARSEITKGYEYAPDEWVLLEKEALKRIAPATSKTIEIREFVRFTEVDPLYLETSYYLAPDRSGERAYALLYQALRETGRAAVAEIAMHNREHVLILRAGRSGIIGHTMFYEDEIRSDQEYRADLGPLSKRELELARLFVESLAAPFEPQKYRDRYRERLEAMIAAKVEGREIVEAAPPAPPKPDFSDMVSALEKSLELVRKPPARKVPETPRRRGTKTSER